MTVRPGAEWGTTAEIPDGALEAATDAELAELLGRADGRPIVVRGGDLHRTIGGRDSTAAGLRLPIDLVDVEVDGTAYTAVAHVIVRRPGPLGWWRGPIVAVMNAEYLGDWDVAPRSHPNDGRLDVVRVDAAMSLGQRWQARRRLPVGGHVPHPAIAMTRRAEAEIDLDRPLSVFVDGVERGRARSLTVTVRPDAAEIYV